MGAKIYFTDLELEVLAGALTTDDSVDSERVAAMESADRKIQEALGHGGESREHEQ